MKQIASRTCGPCPSHQTETNEARDSPGSCGTRTRGAPTTAPPSTAPPSPHASLAPCSTQARATTRKHLRGVSISGENRASKRAVERSWRGGEKRTSRRWICGSASAGAGAGARAPRRGPRGRRRHRAAIARRAPGAGAAPRTPAAAPPRPPSTASRRASRPRRFRPAAASRLGPPPGPPCPRRLRSSARAAAPLPLSCLPAGSSSLSPSLSDQSRGFFLSQKRMPLLRWSSPRYVTCQAGVGGPLRRPSPPGPYARIGIWAGEKHEVESSIGQLIF